MDIFLSMKIAQSPAFDWPDLDIVRQHLFGREARSFKVVKIIFVSFISCLRYFLVFSKRNIHSLSKY